MIFWRVEPHAFLTRHLTIQTQDNKLLTEQACGEEAVHGWSSCESNAGFHWVVEVSWKVSWSRLSEM